MTRRTAWFAAFTHPTPTRLEDWLEQQAARGWEPRQLDDMSAIRMHLQQIKPATMRYVVDPQQKRDASYQAMYEDAGWEHVGELSSLHVWRRRYKGTRPEAFTERASLRARDARLAWASGIVATLVLVGATVRAVVGIAGLGESAPYWPAEAGLLVAMGLPIAWLTVVLTRKAHAPSR